MTPGQENDFLQVEQLLVDRLRSAVAGITPVVHVLTAADLSDVAENMQPTPALHVVYRPFRVLEAREDGRLYRLQHTWLVVSATRNVAQIPSGSPARRDAGELMALAGGAVAGFVPPGFLRPLKATTPPGPGYRAGFQYLPLAFTHETLFHALS